MTPRHGDHDWSDHHRVAVRDAAPEVPELTEGQQDALWQRVRAADDPAPRPRRPRWKTVVAGLVAAGLVGVAGAAAGNVFSAHTGKLPTDAEDVELGGPGERLNPQAPDFAAVLDEVTADVRFPSTRSRDSALSWEVDDLVDPPSEEPVFVSTGAVRLWMSGHALCAWSNTWAVALHTDDDDAAERAAQVILGAHAWPSITDTDPDQAHESEFAWLPDLERAVRAHDPLAAKRALRTNGSCLPGLAPELGLGKRW